MGSINGPWMHWLSAELSQWEAPAGGPSAEGGRVQVEIMGSSPHCRGWVPPPYSPAQGPLLHPPFPGLGLQSALCCFLNPPTPLSTAPSLSPPQLHHWDPDSSNHLMAGCFLCSIPPATAWFFPNFTDPLPAVSPLSALLFPIVQITP